MEKTLLITDALTYIEANLTEDLKTEEVARKLYCSKSTLEKLFRVVLHISIKEYSIRRRMSLAAREIRDKPAVSFLELAVKYGYGSKEAGTGIDGGRYCIPHRRRRICSSDSIRG